MKRLPLWAGLVGAVWMVIAVETVALRAIFVADYLGRRTGMRIPKIGREIPAWQDFWILKFLAGAHQRY
jgi:hypothetical protein